MVQYVGVDNMIRLVETIGVEPFLVGLAGYIEEDFRRWAAFEKAPRVASHSRDGVIELMPASDGALYGFKYVNGHPKNTRSGLQTVTAFGVLSDVATGYPKLLSEMTITTALRTAATSALAARYLARPDASSMAIIGLGAQSEFQALAFKALLGIRNLRIFDIDPAATAKFRSNLSGYGFSITSAASAEEAVLGADIITTVTADKLNATILSDNMVGAGVHINAVGGDCPGKTELHRDILLRADVFVEFPEQTRIEGEIQQMEADFPVTELWRVIAGEAPGRRAPEQITLFDSVGFATEDFSALRYLRDRVAGTDFFDEIDLVTEPEDPRDLFGLIARHHGAAAMTSTGGAR
ncbi:MAG: ornithine cyclodeaminase [Chelatococcus sp.]|jgi:ornithine cyclodeaminase|uniref:ornithine cyclodeaminase n=1 Tax=unclassified Chelatococcus TaxID=2638111 RepID=UPI001BCEF68A|nr:MULTISPECIES: ornithine cyclodeaminase [unclassified Chelatococcus]CAH1649917.1 Ornithine cyclodeaminase [Hyphomicrobiales bacterium]MBS7743378.1 ornithine cyclodeaminase [Chelatococcus sp. HY11]MBX3540237.1 ornithine cyclodeaminase [Chelatococcus sp.]MBX3541504.1 ornithine cyclodeaminase [Chelatococcus sp.]MCO5074603.1 ornithine cyclodeaminase [Chelatococcus sp.]